SRLVKAGKFEATTEESRMQEMDAVSIAVPTPLAKTRDPDMGYVIAAADAIGRNCRPGVVVSLERTAYPGTTRELLQPTLAGAGHRRTLHPARSALSRLEDENAQLQDAIHRSGERDQQRDAGGGRAQSCAGLERREEGRERQQGAGTGSRVQERHRRYA